MKRFRPSQAGYWANCAAFQRFTHDVKERPANDAALEGTCAAWVAETVINSSEGIDCDDLIGKSHVNGWMVTEEMASIVQQYVDLLKSFGGTLTAESTVTASPNPLIEGTLDSSVSNVTNGILRIVDLKYGYRIVETTTKQLVCYGWGEFIKYPKGTVNEIHLSIYQPRGFHKDGIFRTRILTPQQLYDEFLELWNMAVEGEKPDSLATPGAHCYECDAAASCEALAHSVYKAYDIIRSKNQRDLTPQELANELDFADEYEKMISARFKAIRTEAEARIKTESIPGWTVKNLLGNSVFKVSPTTVKLLTGKDPYASPKPCTPAELLRRGASPEIVKKITERPSTGQKLVKITSDDIAAIFNKK